MASTLVSRNITINGRRTSIRLEAGMWDALHEVAKEKGLTIHQYCSEVEAKRQESTLTAAIRVALLDYYRHGQSGKGRCNGTGNNGSDHDPVK